MLIGDPLCEGSNASSTNSELWRAENSFLRGNSNTQEWGTNRGQTNLNKGTKLPSNKGTKLTNSNKGTKQKAEHSMC